VNIYVRPDGNAQCIYDEAIELDRVGAVAIRRASHVEPAANGPGWTADLSPVGGPILGPFPKRNEALAAEIAWLEVHLASGPVTVREEQNE
jgi:hypothetical protein